MSSVPLSLGSARDAPPYFAGRRRELKALRDRLRRIRTTRDPRGGMVLVDGLQGVGKTQLLSQFCSAAVKDDHRAAVLRVSVTDLANPLALFASIVHALGGDDRAAKQIADEAGDLTGARIAGIGVSAQRGTPLGLSINAMLVRSKHGGLWQGRTLVVAVDEIQAIGVDERRTLLALHEGMHECPIMLVGAGLQHAAMRLAATMRKADGTVDESGISRFAERLTLGPLDETDASTAIVRGLEALGVGIDKARAGPLATASMGFPQHIHGYLRGATSTTGCPSASRRSTTTWARRWRATTRGAEPSRRLRPAARRRATCAVERASIPAGAAPKTALVGASVV